MPGALKTWPSWPEFTASKGEEDLTGELIQYKKNIISIYGEEAIQKSWLEVCKELETITDEIADKGTSAIPEIQYDEMFSMGEVEKQNLKDTGCFVVRGIIEEEQANTWFKDLKEYVADNRANVGGEFYLLRIRVTLILTV